MQQQGLDFGGESPREFVLEPEHVGKCCDCGHGRQVELEDPDGKAVRGAGKWIRCALREPGRFNAPQSLCLIDPPKFFPRVTP